jgi:hypothetical protein
LSPNDISLLENIPNSNLEHKLYRFIRVINLWTKGRERKEQFLHYGKLQFSRSIIFFMNGALNSWKRTKSPWVFANVVTYPNSCFRLDHTILHSLCKTSYSWSLNFLPIGSLQRHWPGLLFSKVKIPNKWLHHCQSMSRSQEQTQQHDQRLLEREWGDLNFNLIFSTK